MKRFLWVFLLPFLAGGAGCGPTYPKETLADSLVRLCQKEYGVDVSVQIVGKTLGVYVPLEKLFDSTLRLSPDVGEQLDGVILSTSRVVLSTDDPPDFYVIVAQDKRIPGVELKLVRYVQDIRRLWYHDISRGEFQLRMIYEFGFDLGIFQRDEGEAFHLEEVKLETFLAHQIAFRVKARLEENFSQNRILFRAVKGEFIPSIHLGNGGKFVLTLDVQPETGDLWKIGGNQEIQEKILASTLDVTTHVLRGYRFEAFDSIEIRTPFFKQAFLVDREVLELYRRKKIDLSELLLPRHFDLSPHDTELLLKQ